MSLPPYLLLGGAFGFVLIEAEVVSWFRIQEMFRFGSFHMYGIIGTAVITAALSLLVIKRLGVRDADGQPLALQRRNLAAACAIWRAGRFSASDGRSRGRAQVRSLRFSGRAYR
jgi:uncharacterized protein